MELQLQSVSRFKSSCVQVCIQKELLTLKAFGI